MIQPAILGGESPKGSLSDGDILCNKRRIKEGIIAEEAKKILDFGSILGIETKDREEQILERLRRMEERDMQGSDLKQLRSIPAKQRDEFRLNMAKVQPIFEYESSHPRRCWPDPPRRFRKPHMEEGSSEIGCN